MAAALVAVAGVAVIGALVHAFPDALRTGDDWGQLVFLVGFLVLLATGASRLRAAPFMQHVTHVAIWAVVAAILALGWAYRSELREAPQRLQMAFSSGAPVSVGEHEVAIPRSQGGHYVVEALVNGRPVRFVVDTGATDTVLSPEDARRVGVDLGALDFGLPAETANGVTYGAPYRGTLEVGPMVMADFPMTINQSPMRRSLLGMSFLNRLDSFEVRGDRLLLRWRDRVG
jgi:aspartyl protease family protein